MTLEEFLLLRQKFCGSIVAALEHEIYRLSLAFDHGEFALENAKSALNINHGKLEAYGEILSFIGKPNTDKNNENSDSD